MTTRKELGEMLITGKPMQVNLATCAWTDLDDDQVDDDEVVFYVGLEYRLKTTITYYRVWVDEDDYPKVMKSTSPLSPWTRVRGSHIKDFQIEE